MDIYGCGVDTRPDIKITTTSMKDVEELWLLARLIEAEAGNQDFYGKQLVADVVFNRVDSDTFPDSIPDVIFQDGQFTVIENGAFIKNLAVSDESFEAAKSEYGSRINTDVMYFSKGKSKYMKHKQFKHQDHWFGW